MSKLAGQWVDLFRAGDYSADGKGSFTPQDLDEIVNNYDPADYEAPSTFGHPKPNDSAPAYGWWSKLRRVGDLLQGQMGRVQPEFEEALERELYKKRSVGLMKRAQGWTLHHVAWLGAQAPHIKGLADLKFSAEANSIEIDFSEESEMVGITEDDKKSLIDSFKDAVKSLLPSATAPAATAPQFSEADLQAKVAAAMKPLEDKLAAFATQFSERETSLATSESKQRAATAITGLKTKGAYVPAFDRMGLPQVFEELATSTQTIEFGEGDQKAKKSPLDVLVGFMEGLKKLVPDSPVWKGETPGTAAPTKQFNESGRAPVDQNSVQLDQLTRARSKEKSITYGEAMEQIVREQPELAKPGNAAAGAV